MNLTLGYDVNGNKVLKIKIPGETGFSIQTLGNLPKTHRMQIGTIDHFIASNEAHGFIKAYGTARQKDLFGFQINN